MKLKTLLIATHNAGKLREIGPLLAGAAAEIKTLADYGITAAPDETEATFAGNALLKAEFYARETAAYTLAEDSGLVVDALSGAPGVYSARYGGAGLTDAERCELVLAKLAAVPDEERTARFVTVAVLCAPNGEKLCQAEGTVSGVITRAPAGDNGFGYDPIFYVKSHKMTTAMMSAAEKAKISHRGQAMRQMADMIKGLEL